MTDQSKMPTIRMGWVVTFAGLAINLALGVLYAWSIFRSEIERSILAGEDTAAGGFDWPLAAINDPYAVCTLVFAFSMIPAGKLRDKFGPRSAVILSAILVGLGFILISLSTSYWVWILGFGVLAGFGIGCGYASATPAALAWFPPQKVGLIAGLVVAGFGLAPAYIAPLTNHMIDLYGLVSTMQILGIAFFLALIILSFILVQPPPGYVPPEKPGGSASKIQPVGESPPSDALKSKNFYLIWLAYFIGAGAGLMVISAINSMAEASMAEYAFVAVAILAVGNGSGRPVAGALSDYLGRENTLMVMFGFQALLMFLAIAVVGIEGVHWLLVLIVAILIGFNYGSNLALFPAITKDLWGIKNFGINYGLLFTSCGVGGLVFSRAYQMILAATGSDAYAFLAAGILLLLGIGLLFYIKQELIKLKKELGIATEQQ